MSSTLTLFISGSISHWPYNVDFKSTFVTLILRLYSLVMRRDSEVPLEVGNGITWHPGVRNVSLSLSWAVAKGTVRTTCSSVVDARYFSEYVLFLSFRLFFSHSLFFSSPSPPISPPMSIHAIQNFSKRNRWSSSGLGNTANRRNQFVRFHCRLYKRWRILVMYMDRLILTIHRKDWRNALLMRTVNAR